MNKTIPVSEPSLVGNEMAYVIDAIEKGWISSAGSYVNRFEDSFAEFCDVTHAIACCNGTAALHLALLALGVGPGDEVIIPTLTFVATANAISYCGAKPIFVDSERDTWTMDVSLLEEKITTRTKAIIAVHLFGHPVNMDPLLEVAKRYNLLVVEDAAEAHGARYKDRLVGCLGDIAIFSFYGNKILTTGEGGMVVTNSAALAETVRQTRGQGMDPHKRYWFPVIGYNYRMTNVAAAIGLAQIENAMWHIDRRREIHKLYEEELEGIAGIGFQIEMSWANSAYWMNAITLNDLSEGERDVLMIKLAEKGIETRPFFYPMHILPMYKEERYDNNFVIAERLASCGICLPSFGLLEEDDIKQVCEQLRLLVGLESKNRREGWYREI